MKRIHFFAVESDWLPVFEYLQNKQCIAYTSLNHQYQAEAPSYTDGRSLPNLGKASFEQTIACDGYLVTPLAAPLNVNTFVQNDGRKRFDIHSIANPDSVRLIHAGRWKDMIIAGLIDTMSDGPLAQALMRSFHNPMKKHFTRVNAFWVGPQAHAEWLAGRRLTGAEQSPPMYDLRKIKETD